EENATAGPKVRGVAWKVRGLRQEQAERRRTAKKAGPIVIRYNHLKGAEISHRPKGLQKYSLRSTVPFCLGSFCARPRFALGRGAQRSRRCADLCRGKGLLWQVGPLLLDAGDYAVGVCLASPQSRQILSASRGQCPVVVRFVVLTGGHRHGAVLPSAGQAAVGGVTTFGSARRTGTGTRGAKGLVVERQACPTRRWQYQSAARY